MVDPDWLLGIGDREFRYKMGDCVVGKGIGNWEWELGKRIGV